MKKFVGNLFRLGFNITLRMKFLDGYVVAFIKKLHSRPSTARYGNSITRIFREVYHKANESRRLKNIELINGLKFRIDITDSSGWFLFLYKRYTEKITQEFVLENLNGNSVFLDVGANQGYFSILAASKISKQGHVYAFEPNPAMCDLIKASTSLNEYNNRITILNNAVSSTDNEILKLYLSGNVSSHNSTIVPDERTTPYRSFDQCINVNTISLDSFCRENNIAPTIIKIDVEGAEKLVIEGMKELLSAKSVRYLILETSPGEGIDKALSPYGYRARELEIFDKKKKFGNYLFELN